MNLRFTMRACAGLLALFAAGPIASAQAATGTVTEWADGAYRYTTDSGTNSLVVLSGANGRWVLEDANVSAITFTGTNCAQGARPSIVTCTASTWQGDFRLTLGDGDDTARVDASVPPIPPDTGLISVRGEDGDDYLVNNSVEPTSLAGGLGDDLLTGGPVKDVGLSGGEGNDSLRGRGGADNINGGPGRDLVTYGGEGRTAGVRAVLDGVTPSGNEAVDGTGDTLVDVEEITGTSYTDVLTGNAGDNVLRGNGGVDQLNGLGGDDTLVASGGPSWLDGGDGNDQLQAKNGVKDQLSCGAGTDAATIDVTEVFLPFAGCETTTS